MLCSKRQQSQMPGALDGCSKLALVLGACASLTTRTNLAIVCDKALEQFHVFIIDLLFFI